MTGVPEPSFVKRVGTPPFARDRPHPSQPETRRTETIQVEIVTPDEYCAALLMQYAAPVFQAEIISGSATTIRLLPPAGAGWVLELISLVKRWLESAPLPCATVTYGGRGYLIRASTAASAARDADITSVPAT